MWNGTEWIPAPPSIAPPPPPQATHVVAPQVTHYPPPPPSFLSRAPVQHHAQKKGLSAVTVIITIVILIVGGATGGILWAAGVFSSSENELHGQWMDGSGYGIEYKSNGEIVELQKNNGEIQVYESEFFGPNYSLTWSVNGDILTQKILRVGNFTFFECDDGGEIPGGLLNDGDDDCEDGSDEDAYFECDDGEKIPMDFVNDWEDDCEDGSDEKVKTTSEWEFVFRYEIKGDYLYTGFIQWIIDGFPLLDDPITEAEICSVVDYECDVSWRATVNNPSNAEIETNAPTWWNWTDT